MKYLYKNEQSILHIGNVAGVPQILSIAQRKIGYESDTLSLAINPYKFESDISFQTKYNWTPLKYLEGIIYFIRISKEYTILHFHISLLSGLYIPLWKLLKKKVIIHHHGSDIRYRHESLMCSKFADNIFVSTPDLLKWSPKAVWIPNPISLDKFPYIGVENKSERINIVHAPTNREIKGTKHIIKAFNKLRNMGYKVELTLVENIPHHEAVEYYKRADIIIDWINPNYGIYGMVSIENMALGKPVICTINEKFKDIYFKDLPILSSDTNNLVDKLRILIEDYNLRNDLGKKGRKYVEKIHDSNKIAKKVVSYY